MQKLIAGVAALAIVAVAAPAFAADNATATASANIITPLAVTKTQDLVFGNILANTGGTVTIATDGSRSKTGAVDLLTGVTTKAAHFHIVGDTNGGATYHVDYTKVDLTDGTHTMALALGAPDSAPTSGTADTSIGGTITVASGQAAGTYLGSVTATATYN